MATGLYNRVIKHNKESHHDLMVFAWSHTPWMINVYVGSPSRDGEREALCRDTEIKKWCLDTFGRECWPNQGRDGDWQRSQATIDGWTWFGFKSKQLMDNFLKKWPHDKSSNLCKSCDGTGHNPIQLGLKCFVCNGSGLSDQKQFSIYQQ